MSNNTLPFWSLNSRSRGRNRSKTSGKPVSPHHACASRGLAGMPGDAIVVGEPDSSTGAIYVTGQATSTDFPSFNLEGPHAGPAPPGDAFVTSPMSDTMTMV